MTVVDGEARVRRILERIAPGAGAAEVNRDADLRWALDLDSMDVLELCVALRHEFGVEVPESDQAKVRTIASCIEYLSRRAP